jgi:hypothetical protein
LLFGTESQGIESFQFDRLVEVLLRDRILAAAAGIPVTGFEQSHCQSGDAFGSGADLVGDVHFEWNAHQRCTLSRDPSKGFWLVMRERQRELEPVTERRQQ